MEHSLIQASARRRRAFWGSVTTFTVAVLLAALIAPSVLAQQTQSETDRLLEIFSNVFRFVERNYVDEVDPNDLLEGALRGMLESLNDPYSVYLDGSDMRSLNDTTSGEFGGLGMYVGKQQVDEGGAQSGFVEIVAPIEDTPAFRAGIRAGDLIVGIRNAGDEEFTGTGDISLDEAIRLLRGAPGTSVTLRIRRGARAEFDLVIERDMIEVPTVKFAMIGDDIGFLRITQFTPRTRERVDEALAYFRGNGFRSMVIDVRSNPGGLLDAVIDVADLFFDRGTIVGTAGRTSGENDRFVARPGISIGPEVPIVMLIDQGSASAAEILAGALQDRDRAYLVGTTTFGKGSVQQIRRIGTGGFRLTMSRYYLPSGRFIDRVGVEPDLTVEPPRLTDDQTEAYGRLLGAQRVPGWVSENPNPAPADVDRFVLELQGEGYEVPERWLRLNIRNEVNRQSNVQIVYDLEFDEQLREAIRLLQSGEVSVR